MIFCMKRTLFYTRITNKINVFFKTYVMMKQLRVCLHVFSSLAFHLSQAELINERMGRLSATFANLKAHNLSQTNYASSVAVVAVLSKPKPLRNYYY